VPTVQTSVEWVLRLQRRRGITVRNRSTRVAWSMLAIFVVCLAVSVALSVLNGSFQRDPGVNLALYLAFTAFMVVGAVIAGQRPGNAVGWLFSAVGLLSITGVLAMEYAGYAYITRPGSLPGAVVAAWYQQWWTPMLILVFVLILLLFPTGRLLTARWRPVAVAVAAATAGMVVLNALLPTLTLPDTGYTVSNPIGLAAAQGLQDGAVGAVLAGLVLICTGAAILSVALRFRRSQGVERQQLKWFSYAAVLAVLLELALEIIPALRFLAVLGVLFGLVIALIPTAAGIAILRYRLYDIDRLINRTLVYGLLTVLLGGIYVGLVLVLGQLFGGLGAEPPSWAVAGATLAVAAVFQPARRRIQQAVDRRFNRAKYHAATTIQAYSVRLRDQLDLDTLSTELLAVVDQTMEPTRVSLWLRPSAPGSSGTPRSEARPATWAY
jgi:hypothetical protein